MDKFNILFLFPGPVYDARSSVYQKKFILLTEHFNGYILTTSPHSEKLIIGGFNYFSISRGRFLTNLKYIFFCLLKAITLRINKSRVHCIVTYDPLKTGLIGCIIKKILGAKLIVEVNGVYTSQIAWQDGPQNIVSHIKRLLTPFIMRYVFWIADSIYLLFPSQINEFMNVLSHDKIIESFPCWVPTDNFHNIEEKKEVLLAGFPFKIKGVDILIKAFKKICKKYPEWKLKILGWYPDKEELDNAIGDHPQIFHHPPVSYSEMPKHIGQCGIFVLPSRTEAMGRVLVEAAAAGKPRIGSNVDGIPTVIQDKVDGYLVEPENIDDLSQKLEMLMQNKALRIKIGTAALIRANTNFSEKVYINNIVRLYKKVIKISS